MTTESAKFQKLNSLLDQTSLYSQFLAEQIPERHKNFMGEEVDINDDGEAEETPPPTKRQKSTPRKGGKAGGKVESKEPDRYSHLLQGGKLRPYQRKGVDWLISLNQNGLNGILADDMGLGKTIQVVTFLAYLFSQDVKGPFLVAAPLSTVHNWVNEIQKWAPQLPVQLYHGSKQERLQMRKGWGKEGTDDFPTIVTSYEVCLKDKTVLRNIDWKVLCVDEGHRLKNMDCQLIRALKEYKSQNRVLLTGTPLQNQLRELWSLLNFLLPQVFDSLERFESWFNFDTATIEDEEGQQDLIKQERENQVVSKLHEILRPFVLRRTKRDVLAKELPMKLEYVLYTPLTPVQKHYYQAVLERDSTSLFNNKNQSLNNILMQLRKVCNHPFLLREPEDDSGELSTDERLVEWCGKMKLLDAMLRRFQAEGHKVLIFSQMTAMLDILQDFCDYRHYTCCRIDGSTACDRRQEQIKQYSDKNSGAFVFLLSTRAGGLGINLTAADTVIIYDSDWNPTQDDQAQDRCHRIGQKKNVTVYRFITPASVEVSMLKRANSKRKLEQLVIGKANLKDRANKMTGGKNAMLGDLMSLFDANEAATKRREEEEEALKKQGQAAATAAKEEEEEEEEEAEEEEEGEKKEEEELQQEQEEEKPSPSSRKRKSRASTAASTAPISSFFTKKPAGSKEPCKGKSAAKPVRPASSAKACVGSVPKPGRRAAGALHDSSKSKGEGRGKCKGKGKGKGKDKGKGKGEGEGEGSKDSRAAQLARVNPYEDGVLKPAILDALLDRHTQPEEDGVERGFAVIRPNISYRDLF
mmetsp:Transcript_17399/g.33955  ORF Transcript_17399/g.33955 Transcript_17399/m.33955 type:complete len:807 (+) Transcript_17399:89-2509(+)